MKVTESTIERAILRALNTTPGVFAFKTMDQKQFRDGSYIRGSSYQIRGVSDIIALHWGKTYFLEVKTPQGQQSTHQKAFEKKVKATGNVYAVVRSVEDAMKIIQPEPLADMMR
jgi:hypothetical protein